MSILSPAHQVSYYPDVPNDITGGLPINLDSLRDGPPGSKPFYPYSTLIRYAIKGSPNQKLLLEDIYYAIESRFPYFRSAPSGWKNSVRHNLSLNPCFEKMPRPLTDRGKGSYWTVNDNVDPRTGVHRVRKKRTRSNSSQQHQQQQEQAQRQPQGEQADQHQTNQSHTVPTIPMTFDTPVDMPFPIVIVAAFGSMLNVSSREGHQLQPEMDENGNPDWRNVWHNELTKLRAYTEEQDKAGADPEWYRMMVARVRGGLVAIGPDGLPLPLGHPHGHPIDHDIPEDGEDEQEAELKQSRQQ
ncbi:hypothetical protein BU17DRAFT_73101 [Hysterangium stoloniferum]|nr:hypothetical protein BU17DRAFT_73101 [Hysterangium stoloniferum]